MEAEAEAEAAYFSKPEAEAEAEAMKKLPLPDTLLAYLSGLKAAAASLWRKNEKNRLKKETRHDEDRGRQTET